MFYSIQFSVYVFLHFLFWNSKSKIKPFSSCLPVISAQTHRQWKIQKKTPVNKHFWFYCLLSSCGWRVFFRSLCAIIASFVVVLVETRFFSCWRISFCQRKCTTSTDNGFCNLFDVYHTLCLMCFVRLYVSVWPQIIITSQSVKTIKTSKQIEEQEAATADKKKW